MKNTFKRYQPYFSEYKFYYLLVFFGIILMVSSTAATAHIMKWIIDDMFIEKDPNMLLLIPVGLIVIYSVKALGSYIQVVFMQYTGLHIITRIREEFLAKIISLDMNFLFKNRSGELISRITGDILRIQYFVSNMLPDLVQGVLTVIALVGYIIWLNPLLAFYALVVMPTTIYPLMLVAKRLKRLSHSSQEKNADVITRLTEVFNNNEVIKSNATETFEMKRFSDDNWHFFRLNMKAVYTNALVSPLMEIIGASGLAAVIYIGGREVYNENMTVGDFTAFLTAVGLIFQPIRRVSSIYGKIQDSIAATERVFEIFDLDSEIVDGKIKLEDDIKSIEFKNVSLSYDDKIALKNINLKAKSGDTIALVGDSGGGKTSFINLLLRFYDTSSGEILINNQSIKDFTQNSLRFHISVVSQRVYIFQDTLAANVAYGDILDEERVLKALKLADAYEFVSKLSDGIHTLMDEAGSNLSGGQRQRIAIARAIYKHASLLLFDEATSALDNKSEKRIQDAIKDYCKDKITFTIAHRLSTVKHSDVILVFKNGEIVAQGTH
ncbi:ABC transporter ATP-binding protein, partial [Campylobacterota bacterium]